MRRTIFHVPEQLADMPVFGVGLLLLAWIVICLAAMIWWVARHGFNTETRNSLLVMIAVGVVIALISPRLIEPGKGLPIRGYGVMVVLGAASAVGLAAWRARRMGVDPEVIISLAFWMFVCGVIGARAFYVIQKWDEFAGDLSRILNFTQGGLVVYGSVIGGVGAALAFMLRNKLPLLAIGDLIAPSMLLGLAIGRIGCLLNGCCFGGQCPADWPLALRFPRSPDVSPPYQRQLETGRLHGFQLGENEQGQTIIKSVTPDSIADKHGLKVGNRIKSIQSAPPRALVIVTGDGKQTTLALDELPERSLPVHPTQIYSSINAFLQFFLLWVIYPFRRRDGEVFGVMIVVYPLTRILLENIRVDEFGQFGTALTISQIVGLLILLAAAAYWWIILRQPRGSVLPPT